MGTKFCTACGTKLKPEIKFCTNCGKQVGIPITEQTQQKVLDTEQLSSPIGDANGKVPLKKTLLGFYVMLNLPLYAISGGDDQILGFLVYSFIITIAIAIRMKKEKTFNWVLKIPIVLQLVFTVGILLSQADSLFVDLHSIMGTLVFSLIAMVLLTMLLKGNTSRKIKNLHS